MALAYDRPGGSVRLSGPSWCALYPTGRTTASLVQPFRSNVQRFITALERGHVRVSVNATLRPPERAYLMRVAWDIAHGSVDPRRAPTWAGVDVNWWHGDARASVAAAKAMVETYALAYKPSLNSRHIEGRAIDM